VVTRVTNPTTTGLIGRMILRAGHSSTEVRLVCRAMERTSQGETTLVSHTKIHARSSCTLALGAVASPQVHSKSKFTITTSGSDRDADMT
jgi:hypothetical protein